MRFRRTEDKPAGGAAAGGAAKPQVEGGAARAETGWRGVEERGERGVLVAGRGEGGERAAPVACTAAVAALLFGAGSVVGRGRRARTGFSIKADKFCDVVRPRRRGRCLGSLFGEQGSRLGGGFDISNE